MTALARPVAPGTLTAALVALGSAGAAYGALRAGHALTGTGESVPNNPVTAFAAVSSGSLSWPWVSTPLVVVAVAAAAAVIAVSYRRRRRADQRTVFADPVPGAGAAGGVVRWESILTVGPPSTGRTAPLLPVIGTDDKAVMLRHLRAHRHVADEQDGDLA